MPRIPNRRDDDREPIAPAPIAEAPPAPATPPPTPLQPVVAPVGDPSLPPSAADEAAAEIGDPVAAGEEGAPPPTSAPLPPIIPTEAHEAEADLLLADAEDPPRAAPARGWRADAQRVYRMVSDELLLATGGKRLPTIEEIDRAIDGAVARTLGRQGTATAGSRPSPEFRLAAMSQFTESDAMDVRNTSGSVDEDGAKDWLDPQRAETMEQSADGSDDSLQEPAADRITAIIRPSEVPSSALPSDVEALMSGSTSLTPAISPVEANLRSLPNLGYLDALRRDLADPVTSTRYISKIKKTPARMNGIALNRADYFIAVRDGIWRNLKGLPPTKGSFNDNQAALAAALKARQDAISRLDSEPNLQSVTGQADARAFVADIAKITANAKIQGTQQHEKYLMIVAGKVMANWSLWPLAPEGCRAAHSQDWQAEAQCRCRKASLLSLLFTPTHPMLSRSLMKAIPMACGERMCRSTRSAQKAGSRSSRRRAK